MSPAGLVSVLGVMPDPLTLPELPVLRGERVLLRGGQDSDIDDRLVYPIDPEEEDAYGSGWRRVWDGRRYHTREHLTAAREPSKPGHYAWAVEHEGRCIGRVKLRVNAGQHRGVYSVGVFVPELRGRGLGREITELTLDWGFGVLGLHRIELEVLAGNTRALRCYLACGFRQEGIRRQAELYPGGWQDFISMGVLASEHAAARTAG